MSEVSFYVFEKKEEGGNLFQKWNKKSYERVARFDKKMEVKDVAKALTEQGASYLRHRSQVANIKNTLPLIRESFNGKYIEMDFSGLSKSRTRISRGSTSTISTQKYFYHLSDDTTYDPEFVHEVLVGLFDKLSIKKETIMIKSDNAPTQYKNKHAFNSVQTLPNDYNVKIIRIYGGAGHGKGFIDSMSTFGVKSIVRRDVVGLDHWFADSKEMCQYLRFRNNERMVYSKTDPKFVDKRRSEKKEIEIKGCKLGHLFLYESNSRKILMNEYLCDCESCLNLGILGAKSQLRVLVRSAMIFWKSVW